MSGQTGQCVLPPVEQGNVNDFIAVTTPCHRMVLFAPEIRKRPKNVMKEIA